MRFAGFELDEKQRALRLGGRELELQPRVFDLLVYLIEHRDRVVAKQELLERLWPDVIVVDGALQRVVSLARSALREGGAESAIRTYARHGYRFCAAVNEVACEPVLQDVAGTLLEKARRAFDQCEWELAAESFVEADCQGGVTGRDLERWAEAVRWAGFPSDAILPLERAVTAYQAAGELMRAAHAALLLTQQQFESREFAVARGWHRRAKHFLGDDESSREFALLQWMECRFALVDGRIAQAQVLAEQTRLLGAHLADTDIEVLGLMYAGHALLASGEVERGVACHDEAAAAVMAGGMSAWAGGLVYCGVIWACRNRGDWQRAGQWTEHFTRWCQRSGVKAFPGTCRLHRAEVLSMRGELDEAAREITESCEQLSRAAPWAEGDAYRVLGDLYLIRGEFAEAEAAYRRSHELGWDPQPGYAQLQLAQGHAEAAYRSLERALQGQDWSSAQRRGLYLAHLVMIAAAAGDHAYAHERLATLENAPELCPTSAMAATLAQARGELALSEAQYKKACGAFREGMVLWREIGAPLQVATLRLRLVQGLLADHDHEGAEWELAAAESTFCDLNIRPLLQRCETLRQVLVS